MAQHAYQLRSRYEQLDPNTTISLPDGTAYEVGKAFADAKDGVVVVDAASPEHAALEDYFAVKRAAVPAKAKPTTSSTGASAPKEA